MNGGKKFDYKIRDEWQKLIHDIYIEGERSFIFFKNKVGKVLYHHLIKKRKNPLKISYTNKPI